MRELEQFAATRIRKGGVQEQDRTTGNLVGAAFLHTTSRALDPQLHTHFVLFNCTWDKKEKRWKALQTGDMFGAINYGTAVYRNELAKRLHQIGYPTRQTGSAFEIEGVEAKLIERFLETVAATGHGRQSVRKQKLGRKLTKQEVAHVVHQSRPKKLKGVRMNRCAHQQLGEIGFFEKRSLRKVVEAANGLPAGFAQRVGTDEAVSHGIGHVFERHSVAPQHRILEAALVKGCGQLDLPQLKKELVERPELVRVEPAAFREIVELAAAKQTDKAFAKLLELGAVTEALTDDGKLYQRAADAYLSATKQGRSALLVSPTWSEIDAVTEKVRETLKAGGVVGQQDEAVTVFDSLSWTEAQKKNASQYEPGQRLRFVRQTKHFDRGETVEVVATVENGLRVRRPDGTEVNFIPANVAASFDVGEARELKVPLAIGCCCKPTTAKSSSTASASKSGRSKTAASPWLMAGRSRPGSTPSPTATPSRRIQFTKQDRG